MTPCDDRHPVVVAQSRDAQQRERLAALGSGRSNSGPVRDSRSHVSLRPSIFASRGPVGLHVGPHQLVDDERAGRRTPAVIEHLADDRRWPDGPRSRPATCA